MGRETKPKPNYEASILYHLKASGISMTVREIKELTGLKDRQKIKKVCDNYHSVGSFGRSPARGNGFKYKFIRDMGEVPLPVEIEETPSNEQIIKMNSVTIVALVTKWSNEKWTPKIFKSARNFPLAMANIFKRAADVGYASRVGQEELLETRQLIEDFKSDLEQTLKVVNGVLQTQEIWDVTEFAPFLIEVANPDKLREIAHAVERIN